MRPVALIQARMGSTRLPGKVLMPILGRPMLWHIVERVRQASEIAEVVVATSTQAADESIERLCQDAGIDVFTGSEKDVLDRFYWAALRFQGDPVIRITADCPLVDPELISRLVTLYQTGQYDHVGIATGAGAAFMDGGRFPDGLDAECFSFSALARAWKEATEPSDREHVTPYMWRIPGRFRLQNLTAETDYSQFRWTVDKREDFQLVSAVYEALYPDNPIFGMQDVLAFLAQHPDLAASNSHLSGGEDYLKVWNPGETSKPVRSDTGAGF